MTLHALVPHKDSIYKLPFYPTLDEEKSTREI